VALSFLVLILLILSIFGGGYTMKQNKTVTLILKAVALGMAIASLVLGIMGVTTPETGVTMLSIGLFALALVALQKENVQ
jgi:hypothetical protein